MGAPAAKKSQEEFPEMLVHLAERGVGKVGGEVAGEVRMVEEIEGVDAQAQNTKLFS